VCSARANGLDIAIVGSGIRGIWHLTHEAEQAVSEARLVFCSVYNVGVSDQVRALNPAAPILFEEDGEYRPGMFRPDMYRRMAQRVVDAARSGPGVVVLHPGSALVVDQVTQNILKAGSAAGLRVGVLPGISAVESVLAALGHDLSDGLQIVLAQKLVLHAMVLDPGQAAMIIQPAYYDTLHFAGTPRSRVGRFAELEAALARTWDAQTPAALVISPMEAGHEGNVFWFRLGALGRLHDRLSPLHTMFIPARRAVAEDQAFAARIASWPALMGHLASDPFGALAQQTRPEVYEAPLDPPPDLADESARLAQAWQARWTAPRGGA